MPAQIVARKRACLILILCDGGFLFKHVKYGGDEKWQKG